MGAMDATDMAGAMGATGAINATSASRARGATGDPSPVTLRLARPDDAAALRAIYAPYVRDTAITFEYDVPDVAEFRARIQATTRRYPYLVAVCDGRPVGYAYAGQFHARAAYDWAVETSIYVARDARRHGVGRALYDGLEASLHEMGVLNLNACIAYPPAEDEHLTRDSVRFHEHLGYAMVGRFHACGYKFDRWYDMVWMEKMIGEHTSHQPPVTPFPQACDAIRAHCGIA